MHTPIPRIGRRFLIFGIPELIAALIVGNSALLANAIDNLCDSLYMTAGGRLDDRLARSLNHTRYCIWRGRLGIASATVALPFIMLGILLDWHGNKAGPVQMIVSLIAGSIGIALTLKGHHEIGNHGDHHHGGFDTHLLQDLAAAAVAAASSILAYASGRPVRNLVGSFVILAIALSLGLRKTQELHLLINHSDSEHRHDLESKKFHERHAPSA